MRVMDEQRGSYRARVMVLHLFLISTLGPRDADADHVDLEPAELRTGHSGGAAVSTADGARQ